MQEQNQYKVCSKYIMHGCLPSIRPSSFPFNSLCFHDNFLFKTSLIYLYLAKVSSNLSDTIAINKQAMNTAFSTSLQLAATLKHFAFLHSFQASHKQTIFNNFI